MIFCLQGWEWFEGQEVQKRWGCDSGTLYTRACWKPCPTNIRLRGFRGAWSLQGLWQEPPHHPFHYLHDFSGKTSHPQNRTVVEGAKKWGKRLSSLHLTEQPANQCAAFGGNQVFLASLSTLGVKQDISGSVVCSPGGRACNMEEDLYELSKKNHP